MSTSVTVDKIETGGWESALRGMRNPKNSWERSDSLIGFTDKLYGDFFIDLAIKWIQEENIEDEKTRVKRTNELTESLIKNNMTFGHNLQKGCGNIVCIGPKDLKLAQALISGGPVHSKFLRQITVNMDISGPAYWWAELDTYKVGTTRNSCSFQHKGVSKEFSLDDFLCCEEEDEGFIGEYQECFKQIVNILNKEREQYLEDKNYYHFRRIRQMLPMGYNYKATFSCNYAVLRNIIHWRQAHKLKEWHDFCACLKSLPYAEEFLFYKNNAGNENI